MRKLITAMATILFTASVSASGDVDVYQGFEQGNPDLSNDTGYSEGVTARQPGVGDSYDLYHGFADNNPELFWGGSSSLSQSSSPDIYGGFGGNPDL